MHVVNHKQLIRNSCEQVLDSVRSSNLNFSTNETPFSIYLTVRKSFVKFSNTNEPTVTSSEVISRASNDYHDALIKTKEEENDELQKTLGEATEEVKRLKEKIDAPEIKIKKGDRELHHHNDKFKS